nr:plastidic RNA polymerase sigma-subunit 2 [Passiflora tenuiloba]
MSRLLIQIKSQPVTFGFHCGTQHRRAPDRTLSFSKYRELIWSQTQCSLSTTSPSTLALTAVVDLEKLRLPSIESLSHSVAENRSWMYTGTIESPEEKAFGATFSAETLITSVEAVIAAAATKAITLAREALTVAKDAALMVENYHLGQTGSEDALPSGVAISSCTSSLVAETERAGMLGDSLVTETGLREDTSSISCKETDYFEPTKNELALFQKQLCEGIAVRSRRKIERSVKRAKAAEKAAIIVVSAEQSRNKKKRSSFQHIDYSDPYLRGTNSTSRLHTDTEELDLFGGIQGLVKLERLQEELRKRWESGPSLAQWAAAAGVDQKTLRKRLNYGMICKHKILKRNLGLVISISKKYHRSGMNFQDLVQDGCRGLLRSAEKFDVSKGFKFSTYAHSWIKQSVLKSLSAQSSIIRVPFHLVEASIRVKKARKRLFSEKGREPDDEEIADATRLSMKMLNTLLQIPKPPGSLDQKIGLNMDIEPLVCLT